MPLDAGCEIRWSWRPVGLPTRKHWLIADAAQTTRPPDTPTRNGGGLAGTLDEIDRLLEALANPPTGLRASRSLLDRLTTAAGRIADGLGPEPDAEMDRLSFRPCVPPDWESFTLSYRYRETTYAITVRQGAGDGVRLVLHGTEQNEGSIRLVDDGQPHTVEVEIGPADDSSPAIAEPPPASSLPTR